MKSRTCLKESTSMVTSACAIHSLAMMLNVTQCYGTQICVTSNIVASYAAAQLHQQETGWLTPLRPNACLACPPRSWSRQLRQSSIDALLVGNDSGQPTIQGITLWLSLPDIWSPSKHSIFSGKPALSIQLPRGIQASLPVNPLRQRKAALAITKCRDDDNFSPTWDREQTHAPSPTDLLHLCRITSAVNRILARSISQRGKDARQSSPGMQWMHFRPYILWRQGVS